MGVKCGSHKDISVVEDMGEGFYGKSKGVSHEATVLLVKGYYIKIIS
jgi:hypothetical protein